VTTPKGPQLAVLPSAAEDDASPRAQVLQPSGWPMPKGYANGMAAEGRIVVTGGVIGWDAEERSRGRLLSRRYAQTLSNIAEILGEAGARARAPRAPDPGTSLTWTSTCEPEGARQDLPYGLWSALSCYGACAGRRLVEKAARVEIEGHRCHSSLNYAQLAVSARLGEILVLG